MNRPYALGCAFPLFLLGCTFNFDLTSQRTALENQVLGAYRDLDDEIILMSTMRGPQSESASETRKVAPRVVDQRRNQEFNRDDIEELKDLGVVGETRDGLLALLPTSKRQKGADAQAPLAALLVAEENRDRRLIWQHIIRRSRNLTLQDLPKVGRTYGDMQVTKVSPGQWYQSHAGDWIQQPVTKVHPE